MRPAPRRSLVLAVVAALVPAQSHAETVDTGFGADPAGELTVDGTLVTGFPTALPTGLVRGLGAGVTVGKVLAWGARLSWATASESSMAWDVTHRDLRARITGAMQHAAGRATLAVRLGLGGSLVNEVRRRHQGARAGLTGDELETSAWSMLPAATAEAVVVLRIKGPWALVVSGGPTAHLDGDIVRFGWGADVGVSWQR